MFTLKRITTEPGSPLKIIVQQKEEGDQDAGLAAGGSFWFYPAGSEEGPSAHQASLHAARAIMDDPGIARHFECTPPLPGTVKAEAEDDRADDAQDGAAVPVDDDSKPATDRPRWSRK